MTTSITNVAGIGPHAAKALAEHGIRSAEDLARATPATLNEVPGFGAVRAERCIAAARALVGSAPTAIAAKAGPRKAKSPRSIKKNKKAGGKKSRKKDPGKRDEKKKGKKGKGKAGRGSGDSKKGGKRRGKKSKKKDGKPGRKGKGKRKGGKK